MAGLSNWVCSSVTIFEKGDIDSFMVDSNLIHESMTMYIMLHK